MTDNEWRPGYLSGMVDRLGKGADPADLLSELLDIQRRREEIYVAIPVSLAEAIVKKLRR